MTPSIKTIYLGNLRTNSTHLKSQNQLITDAPTDNNGRGEAFSPTDLLATSLATCAITIMGIAAQKHNLAIENLACDVTKIMAANPRRVSEIIVEFNFPKNDFSNEQKQILIDAANSCPVAHSLSESLNKKFIFNF
jgi:putative redox protein